MSTRSDEVSGVTLTAEQAKEIRSLAADVCVARRALTKKVLRLEELLYDVGLFDATQRLAGDVSVLRDDESPQCGGAGT